MLRLDNEAARRLFLHKHLLAEPPSGPGKGPDLHDLIEQLGFVQLDSVRTVERAHDMILFSRRPAYRPTHLPKALARDRAVFEHWTHDAAAIPMAFYPYWRMRFERDAMGLQQRWAKDRRDGFVERFDHILTQIRENGPVCSADVGEGEKRGSGGWWDWHPSKTALEYLWRSGQLSVCHREGFRKFYDLTDRVIPSAILDIQPDEQETTDWLCRNALTRLGFATAGEIAGFWDTLRPAEVKPWIEQGLKDGFLQSVEVTGADGSHRACVAFPDIAAEITECPEPTGRMRVLSPFDPALRDRARAERLFGFNYRIEIFTPAAKRKYGYYVFPLLEGDRMVGRVDMKRNQDSGTLVITALWPEHGVRWGQGRQQRLEAELARVLRFAGLEQLEWTPGWLREPQ